MKCFKFTIREFLVLTVIVTLLLGLLLPCLQQVRENSRRQTCLDRLKNLGLAMQSYERVHGRYPGSGEIVTNGSSLSVGGWSFWVWLLPYIDQTTLYQSLLLKSKIDPLVSMDPNVIAARNRQISEMVCPSNPDPYFENHSLRHNAVTNYKTMGATCAESLVFCVQSDALSPYGDPSRHPDGAFFPGPGLRRINSMDSGWSTIYAAETIDHSASTWLAGSDVTLVGMSLNPRGIAANIGRSSLPLRDTASYFRPAGFNGYFYEEGAKSIARLKTFLAYDFSPGGSDEGAYPNSVGRLPSYGASSGHPGIVNHLFNDGSARNLKTDIDYALYFFAITRNNHDNCEPLFDD
jgi:hypothetical protein